MYYYVYRITNKVEKKHYYGKRHSKKHPFMDLGITYFSSSKNKAFIKDQKEHPENYKYKVIKICTSGEEAVMYEIKLHTKFNVAASSHFYNQSKQTAVGFDTTGKVLAKSVDGKIILVDKDVFRNNSSLVGINTGYRHSESTRAKISKGHTGKKRSQEHKDNISKARKGKPIQTSINSLKALEENRYKAHLPEAIAKRRKALKGRKFTEEHKQKLSASQKGIPKPCKLTEEQKIANAYKIGKLADIYNATTNELIAQNIIIGRWAKDNGVEPSTLSRTTRRDLSKPQSKENVHQYKNMYAIYKETYDKANTKRKREAT